LGKTIEVGLVVTELLSRQMARNLLVVCPANLREHWREALEYFFHLDAKIVSGRHRRALERNLPAETNPWEFYRYFVTSIDYAKTPAIRNQLLEQEGDIVLVGEAHLMAKPARQRPTSAWLFLRKFCLRVDQEAPSDKSIGPALPG